MNTTNINLLLAAEFSNPVQTESPPTPEYYISRAKSVLKSLVHEIGNFLGLEKKNTRQIGELFTQQTYVLNFGKYRLEFTLLLFQPSGRWELKDFKIL